MQFADWAARGWEPSWEEGISPWGACQKWEPSKVHRVMSMFFTLIIVLLIGTQAVPKIEENAAGGTATEPTIPRSRRTKTPQGYKEVQGPFSHHHAHRKQGWQGVAHAHNVTVDPKLFKKRRFRSPRVLFSTQPPPLSGDLQSPEYADGNDALNRTSRAKRTAHPVVHFGEFSVCDSISMWVGEKTTATDIKGKEVTVLGEVNINNSVFKQYFFETKCRESKPVSSGCRGIDAKHWNSYCTTTHTFVKALTMEGKQAAWRFIRIDTACVCVLSRKTGRC
uniref:Beta-nerve growth factor isoform X1 n=2 Tax=Geotrypetes seraphini TaxID=260995 RepID=A0A6P8NR97_GEOSA|nr:beta-nerve growth factor isoform X1 [Geotrypetes seraphini]